jgi:hypothetical protein
MSIFEQVAGEKIGALLGNKSLGGIVGGGVGTIGMGMLKSGLPPGLGPKLSVINNVGGKLLKGDLKGAALGALNSGIFTAKFPWLDNLAATAGFMIEPNRAMGGVTPVQAKRIMQGSLETHFARKNLFLVKVERSPKSFEWLSAEAPGGLQMFNMFVTDVSYTGASIVADQHRAGSVSLDQPTGREPIELRITTMDNEEGDIKWHLAALANRISSIDGTMSVPDNYLVRISILHSFVSNDSEKHWTKNAGGFLRTCWFRLASIEHDLSRKDDALEEFTIVFHEFDTYYK